MTDYWSLVLSPVYQGEGMPRGDGRYVLVIPGLFSANIYLRTIRTWLRRIGYTPLRSSIRVNVGCSDRLVSVIEKKLPGGEQPIVIIGHSLGGLMGKALATRLGPRCSHLIGLGSPLGGVLREGIDGLSAALNADAPNALAHQTAIRSGQRALRFLDPKCAAPLCACRYFDDLFGPLHPSTKVWSIYSTDDRVVSRAACPVDGATNIEVRGSHSGLAYNREVFPHIADALAS